MLTRLQSILTRALAIWALILDTVEIVMSLEDEFGIEIEMNESLKTVRDLVNLIEGK